MRDHPDAAASPAIGTDPRTAWAAVSGADDVVAVEPLKHKKRSLVCRLHRRDGPPVIAKRCRERVALLERCMYEVVLPATTLHAPALHGWTPDGGRVDGDPLVWLFLEDLGDKRHDITFPDQRQRLGAWLAEIALVDTAAPTAAGFRVPDRRVAYHRSLLDQLVAVLPSLPQRRAWHGTRACDLIGAAHRALVQASDQWPVVDRHCESAPTVIGHNDCVSKNIVITDPPARHAVPVDWGGAGWSLPGADLGVSAIHFGTEPVAAGATAAYLDRVREAWPHLDVAHLRRGHAIGRIWWALKVMAMSMPRFEHASQRKTLELVGLYSDVLACGLADLAREAR